MDVRQLSAVQPRLPYLSGNESDAWLAGGRKKAHKSLFSLPQPANTWRTHLESPHAIAFPPIYRSARYKKWFLSPPSSLPSLPAATWYLLLHGSFTVRRKPHTCPLPPLPPSYSSRPPSTFPLLPLLPLPLLPSPIQELLLRTGSPAQTHQMVPGTIS